MALVSVVTATYAGDDPAHLAEAIDSVIAQTHRPLQYLIAADGPLTAAQSELIRQRSAEHDWISLRQLVGPRGPAAARNAVLPECRGDFVAILDADDAMVTTRIAEQVDYLSEHRLDLVASWLAIIDQAGHQTEIRRFPEAARDVRRKSAYFCPTANTGALFSAELLGEFRYPPLRLGEDYRLWVQLQRRGRRIGNVPRPLTRYRTGPGYFERRRGRQYASSDLRTKLTAMPLAPWWQWPLVVGNALGTFFVRLLPHRWFEAAYGLFERVTRR